MKKNIRNFTLQELKKEIISLGSPRHRALQVFKWINEKAVTGFSEMTNLPGKFIQLLEEKFYIGTLILSEEMVSRDGTRKFLWELEDKSRIETVVIKEAKRVTFCISTQAGCRYSCPFCASGTIAYKRDLSIGEITAQILDTKKTFKVTPTNIVFMGIGEPLDNFSNLAGAIGIMNDPNGLNIGARKITVSTCGIIPGIKKLMNLGIQVELSVSLHAANDALRNRLVPANRKYPLKKLFAACQEYYKKTKRVITVEYVLIKDVNDSEQDAKELSDFVRGIKGKVNVIKYNSFPGFDLEAPDKKDIDRFIQFIKSKGITATLRKSKGMDISAACGQLAAKKG